VHKLQLLKAGIVLSYASNIQIKLSVLFFFSKVQSVKSNCVFIVCRIAIAISRAHSIRQVSLILSVIQLVYLVTV